MRDDKWLFAKLDEVWDNYFPDVPQDNDVRIVWGRRARVRLGTIKQVSTKNVKNQTPNIFQISNSSTHPATVITINALFKDEFIPEYVVLGTIAHELAHYAHGFHSPIEQKFATPHAGGVIHKELDSRGLAAVHKKQKKWLKENWRDYLSANMSPRKSRRRRVILRWI